MNRTNRIVIPIALAFGITLLLAGAGHPLRADEIATEPAPESKLTAIALPGQAERVTDLSQVTDVITTLDTLFNGAKKKRLDTEVLGWQKGQTSKPEQVTALMQQVAVNLKKAGFVLVTKDANQNGVKIKVVTATKVDTGDLVMGTWLQLPDTLLLAWGRSFLALNPPAAATGGAKLADGDPPLTQGMVNAFGGTLTRVFSIPVNAQLKTQLKQLLTALWRQGDDQSISHLVRLLVLDDHVSRQPHPQASEAFLRFTVLKAAMQPHPDAITQFLKQANDTVFKPLAAGSGGEPPLTTYEQAAFVDFMAFAVSQIPEGPGATDQWLDAAVKTDFGNIAIAAYDKANAAGQEQMALIPASLLYLQNEWPKFSEARRNQLREQWSASFKSVALQVKAAMLFKTNVKEAQRFDALYKAGKAKPADYERLAGFQETTAKALRAAGGAENMVGVQKLEDAAKKMRQEAASLKAGATTAAGGHRSYAEALTQMRSSHSSYVSAYNSSMELYAARMNVIANMGDSPYRWTTSY